MIRLAAALVSLSVIWGMSFMFIKILLLELSPWQIVLYRSVFGLAALAIIYFAKQLTINWREQPYPMLFIVGILNAGIPWGLIALSEKVLPSSLAAILNATTPLWATVIGVLFFGSKLAKRQYIGILAGFFGILLLSGVDSSEEGKLTVVTGVVLMLCATCCYGFSSHLAKKHLQEAGVWVISVSTLLASFFTGLAGSAATGSVAASISWLSVLSLIGLGSFGGGVAYLLYYYLIQKGSAELATLVTYLVPVTAVIWGTVLLNELFTLHAAAGMIFVLAGIFLSAKNKRKEEKDRNFPA
ncbi:DMT family transporter [Fictibacillus iocasae]|uniref:DMT family transporter n=1 Tax=Fictibacillus iocasae TaxID=2715437 RepID=A0ABW2NSP3_9BACL